MIYLGIKNKIIRILDRSNLKAVSSRTIHLTINIDGIPIFKSSNVEFYPILGLCKKLDNTPFAIAIFCGCGKPDPIDIYFENFINEANLLKMNGVQYNNRNYKFVIDCFVCDAPARSYIKQTVGHTSKNACENVILKEHMKIIVSILLKILQFQI